MLEAGYVEMTSILIIRGTYFDGTTSVFRAYGAQCVMRRKQVLAQERATVCAAVEGLEERRAGPIITTTTAVRRVLCAERVPPERTKRVRAAGT